MFCCFLSEPQWELWADAPSLHFLLPLQSNRLHLYMLSLSHSCSETKIVFCLIFLPHSSAICVTRINLSLIWMHDGIKWKLAFCLFTVPWCPCLMNIMWLQHKHSIIFHHIVAKKTPQKTPQIWTCSNLKNCHCFM